MAATMGILDVINAGPDTEKLTLAPPFAGTVTIWLLVPIVTVAVAAVEFGFVRKIESLLRPVKYWFTTSCVAAELTGTALTSFT